MLAWQHNREARTEGRHGAIVRSRPIVRVPRGRALMKRRILVVDIGGTFVKLLMSERVEREFPSGPRVTPKQFLAKLKETARGWKFDVASIVSRRLCAMDEFFETRSTLAKTGCILILPERWEYRCASLTTQPCKRAAVISAAGACCFWGSEQGLDPRWYGVEISCHSSWATSPTRTKTSLRTISVCPAWRNWAKENGNVKSFMPSAN